MNSYSLQLICRPREDERPSWTCWLTYSGRFIHINGYPSAAGPVQTIESSPIRDRRSTTQPTKLDVENETYFIELLLQLDHTHR